MPSTTAAFSTPAGWAIEYLRGLGGFLAMEIEDVILAIRQGDVGWVRRFLTRMPALARCRDGSDKPLLQHAGLTVAVLRIAVVWRT